MSGEFTRIQAEHSAPTPGPSHLKLVLATPTYGPVDSRHAKHLRVAIMHAANNGVTWVGDVSPDRMGWSAARNVAVKAALDTEAGGILWCDSDMIMPADAVTRLVSYGKDFASGVYFQRKPPHHPLVAVFDPDLDTYRWMTKWPLHVIFPADGVGFGFCYTSTAMLRRMATDIPAVIEHGWFDDKYSKFSEDLSFCRHAVSIGCPPYVDTGLLLGHLGDAQEVTLNDFKAVNPYSEGTAELVPVEQNINE